MPAKIFVPDVNIWVAAVCDFHVHHTVAAAWMNSRTAGEAAFCRVTQMGFLRLLTNRHVMRGDVLQQPEAWLIYDKLRRDERIVFLPEPDGIDTRWREMAKRVPASGGLWTDGYLAAFAAVAGLTIATFDKKFPGAATSGVLVLA